MFPIWISHVRGITTEDNSGVIGLRLVSIRIPGKKNRAFSLRLRVVIDNNEEQSGCWTKSGARKRLMRTLIPRARDVLSFFLDDKSNDDFERFIRNFLESNLLRIILVERIIRCIVSFQKSGFYIIGKLYRITFEVDYEKITYDKNNQLYQHIEFE